MTSGDSRGKISETAPRPFEGSYGFAGEAQSFLSTSEDEEQHDIWQQFRLFPSRSSDMSYGAYASLHLGATNAELYNGGHDDVHAVPRIDDLPLDWRLPYPDSKRSRSPFSDSDGSQYSSISDLSSFSTSFAKPYTRLAPIGSRGRGRSLYQWRGRGGDTASTCRAKSRGFCRLRGAENMPSFHSNMSAPECRGTKRFLMAPVPPCKIARKQRVVEKNKKGLNLAEDSYISINVKDMNQKEAVEERRVRVREKRRRRREKNCEKYGDKHRLAFTCAFCKFRTFEDKDIEKHFRSTYHHETLDYIRLHAKFDDRAINFLHDCMVHKFRKTESALRKLRTLSEQKTNQKVMEGVTEDDFMRKVDVVHCMACETYIPAILTSVQQHLSSSLHLKCKVVYKEQLKRESVLTAKAIINNDSVKVRYEKYMKGEDPFVTDGKEETSSDLSEQERPDEAEMFSSDEN
ncbi:DBIRD complex subunit ZNF326 [Trichomycterus rosablanca]|uniref:DBIRD complex subunit ZNF326 n=1 Tax=Trichomycterus rosablanca TaxID=2290929 RepID=UPI002F357AD6